MSDGELTTRQVMDLLGFSVHGSAHQWLARHGIEPLYETSQGVSSVWPADKVLAQVQLLSQGITTAQVREMLGGASLDGALEWLARNQVARTGRSRSLRWDQESVERAMSENPFRNYAKRKGSSS